MNWYKKATDPIEQNPHYTNIGHGDEDYIGSDLDVIWLSDLSGNNFHTANPAEYEHQGLSYDVGIDMTRGGIQGRYDHDKKIVSIKTDPSIVTMREFPNRLINRLYQELFFQCLIWEFYLLLCQNQIILSLVLQI